MTSRINYPTPITLDTATPIAAGRMQADGSDIRVYSDAAHTQPLDFYVENINASDTRLWVKTDHSTGRYHPGIAFYAPMDNSSDDDIIAGATGTPSGTTAFVSGQVNTGIDINGSGSSQINYGTNTATAIFGRAGFSAGAWVFVRSIPSSSPRVFDRNQSSAGWWFLVADPGGGNVTLDALVDYSTTNANAAITNAFALNTWHHIMMTWDDTTGRIVIYIDGELQALDTDVAGSGVVADDTTRTFRIGNDGNGTRAFDGIVDEAVIYHRALSAAEVKSDYLRGLAGKRLSEPQPTAHWTFNSIDNAGSEVVDLVGGHNGTISGGVTVGQKARVGQSFDFNGSTGYITIPDHADFEPHVGASGTSTWSFTLTVPDGTLGASDTIFSKYESTGNQREFGVDNRTGGGLSLWVGDLVGTNNIIFKTDSSLPDNKRVHVAVVWDNSEVANIDKATFYFDGEETSHTIISSAGTFSQMSSGTSDVLVSGINPASPTQLFDGNMEDFLWSSSVLSAAQIAELARRSREGLRPDLTDVSLSPVAYWSFDNVDIGIDPQDIAGQNHGTTTGTISVGQSGPRGQAFDFPGGTGKYVSIADSADVRVFGSTVMTASGWIKPRSAGGASSGQVFDKVPVSSGWSTTTVAPVSSGYRLRGIIYYSSTNSQTYSKDIPLNVWTHFAWTWDSTSNTIDMYINGELSIDSQTPGSGLINNDTGIALYVGQISGDAADRSFDGLISELAIFNSKLTSDQISDMYEKGRAGFDIASSVSKVYVTYGDPNLSSLSNSSTTFTREITGLVAAYEFDEEEGGAAVASLGTSSNSPTGTVKVIPSEFGNARKFDDDGGLEFTSPIIPAGAKTIFLRHRTEQSTLSELLGNFDGYELNPGSLIKLNDGYVTYEQSTGSGINISMTSMTQINDGLFHSIGIVWDGTTNTDAAKLYIDGIEEDTATASGIESLSGNSLMLAGKRRGQIPTEIDNLQLWLDGDDPGLGILDGNSVDVWQDKSGKNNNATQAGSARPIFRSTAGGHGRGSLEFDGIDDYIQTGAIPALDTDTITWFLVWRSDDVVSTDVLLRNQYTSNAGLWGNFVDASEMQVYARTSGGTFRSSEFSVIQNTWYITTGRWTSANVIEAFNNGRDTVAGVSGNTGADHSPSGHIRTRIGADTFSLTNFFDGFISEVIVYNRELVDEEVRQIEAYLSNKYNNLVTRQHSGTMDSLKIFDRALTADEMLALANGFGEVVGTKVFVRSRTDPDPASRVTATTVTAP